MMHHVSGKRWRNLSTSADHPWALQVQVDDRLGGVKRQRAHSSSWVVASVLREVARANDKQIRHAPHLAVLVDYRCRPVAAHQRATTNMGGLIRHGVKIGD